MNQTLDQLIGHLEKTGVLKSEKIKQALRIADRINYVTDHLKPLAYSDSPLVIADGQTISQPTAVVFMLEMMDLQEGQKVLDIGGGCGWVTSLMAAIVGETGHVYSYEINELVGMIGEENIRNNDLKNVTYTIANAAKKWKDHAPYDRIYSGAAFREIPVELKNLLKVGGIMVVPTQEGNVVKIVRVAEDEFVEESHYGYTFVPFIEE